MTFSTASSAASVLENDPAPVSRRAGICLGMDEAGYGPNLGPLLIAVTRWSTPVAPHKCNFYKLLAKALDAGGSRAGSCLHIADSKVVNVGKSGFTALETSALALLRCARLGSETFQTAWAALVCPTIRAQHPLPAWYGEDITLPIQADPQKVEFLSAQLQHEMERCGAQLEAIAADVVTEGRFNQLTRDYDSKGLALSRMSLRLLRRLWEPAGELPVCIHGDKHGGRNRYDDLLAEVLDGEMVLRLEEGRQLSRYRVASTEIRFQVGGEEHLPVAAASIIAKYLREVSMILFNRFWDRHVPGVKPTLGYPGDARRFHTVSGGAGQNLGIDEQQLWRER